MANKKIDKVETISTEDAVILPTGDTTLPIVDTGLPNGEFENECRQEVALTDRELISRLQKKKNKLRKQLKEKGILPKGAVNEYDNYEYFSEAQYKELFTELFSENGIELSVNEISYGTFDGTDKQPFGRVVTLACTLIDIDTGYTETTNHTGEGLDRGDKAGYKATTGALKRFLSSTFLVATKDDPEREDEDKKTTPQRKETKNSITPGQIKIIKNLYKNNIPEFKNILKKYKKIKLEQLTMTEASEIIRKRKEQNDERFNNNR